MGFWGVGLYNNDFTCDVRDTYTQFLQKKYANNEACKKTITTFQECIGTDEEPLLWYALADSQWTLGRLTEDIKGKALHYLQAEYVLLPWAEETKEAIGWQKTLSKLLHKLSRPQPKEKIIEDPADFQFNPGNIGDVFAYQFHSKEAKKTNYYGKYILFQKIGTAENGYGYQCPHVVFFDELFDEIPCSTAISSLRLLPFDPPERFMPSGRNSDFPLLNMSAVLDLYKKKNSPERYIKYIGPSSITQIALNVIDARSEFGWDNIEDTLLTYHSEWQKYSYSTNETESFVFRHCF